MRPDILVNDSVGDTILAVEVKARRDVDLAWARQLRRNLTAHGIYPSSRFFMVVTTDKAFLWHGIDASTVQLDVDPSEVASTGDLLGDRLPANPESLDGRALELIVSAWLNSLAEGIAVSDPAPEVRSFLITSGLQDALSTSGASVAFEVA